MPSRGRRARARSRRRLFPRPARRVRARAGPLVVEPTRPAIAEAAKDGDVHWIARAGGRAAALVMAYAVTAAVVVIVAGERVVAIWTGGRIPVSFDILVAAGGLIITFSFENVTQTLLFGLGRAGGLAAVLLFRSALSLILVWVLAGMVGQEAALAGPIIAALLTSSWLLPLLVVRAVRAKARLQSGHQRRRPGGTAG